MPPALPPDEAADAQPVEHTGVPADGPPPAGTPVSGNGWASLPGVAGRSAGGAAADGVTAPDAADPGDGMGGVGLVA